MWKRYEHFISGISVNRIAQAGTILVSSSFISFIIFEIARLTGILTNAYVGLITYLLFPSLFIIGLILIPIGWIKYRRSRGLTNRKLFNERFRSDETRPDVTGSKVWRLLLILTLVNILFMVGASTRMLHFMDEPVFCGTACHSVMNPEWVTYQVSPHARVKCVECHVGQGVGALVDSKLNGIWQMISITFNLYEKPIPTPVHQLRPARETCEKCHWPDKFYGQRIKNIVRHKYDEGSTPLYTTLSLKIDTGIPGKRKGIHWHVAGENQVRYASVNDQREDILWVELRQYGGGYKRYTNERLAGIGSGQDEVRIMDCVDCHNRATHIYEQPAPAVDGRIESGLIDGSLPFIAREAHSVITSGVSDSVMALDVIENGIRSFYERRYPEMAASNSKTIDTAAAVLQSVYLRNIHPGMNITWGSYPSHIGHKGESRGCFRCHNSALTDSDGNHISHGCTTCHSILAYEDPQPFHFLITDDTTAADEMMRHFLKEEFLRED